MEQLTITPHVSHDEKYFTFNTEKVKVSYCYNDDFSPVNLNLLRKKELNNYGFSTIYTFGNSFTIRPNGTSKKLDFIIEGPLSPKNLANSLPNDYSPKKTN